ncbi:hypothetical protein DP187_24085 [Enterobacter cloacae]|nr:hypothetical protein DP187_24085 [Enterobacter cloacae]
MKILLISEDFFLATALTTKMNICWTGDRVSFVLKTASCEKLVLLVDDRVQRMDYIRIKKAYPRNVFIARLHLTESPLESDTVDAQYEINCRSNTMVLFAHIFQFLAYVQDKTVPLDMRLRITKMEKEVFLFLSCGATVPEIAAVLSLSEKSILGHCYRVMNRYGFQDLIFFCTFMFPRVFHLDHPGLYLKSGSDNTYERCHHAIY